MKVNTNDNTYMIYIFSSVAQHDRLVKIPEIRGIPKILDQEIPRKIPRKIPGEFL
tara:strand:+ start:719 stop:883 length:165 start_codon:yes stop_codon:yes gene_type:complete